MGKRGPQKGMKYAPTLRKQAFREIFMKEMEKEFLPVVKAQIELSKGVAIIDRKDDTGERIFDIKPDAIAGKNILDQAMGKASQPLEHSGEGGGPIVLRWLDA